MKLQDLLPTKRTKKVLDPSKQKILLIASPKFGKSTWCASFPDPLFLTTEEGHDALEINRITIDCWDWLDEERPTDVETRFKVDKRGVRHMAFVDAITILTSTDKFSTLVIDTLDRLYALCEDFVCEKKGIEHQSDEGYGKGWKAVDREFTRAIMALTKMGRGVIFITHVKHKDIENTRIGSKITQAQATIPERCRAAIEPEVNIILHGGFALDKKTEKKVRVWKCEADDSVRECGDRNGVVPPQFPCDKADGYKRFSSYFKKQ